MNFQTNTNDKTTKAHRIASPLPTLRTSAQAGTRQRPVWQAQPSGLSREETRRLVLEMIG